MSKLFKITTIETNTYEAIVKADNLDAAWDIDSSILPNGSKLIDSCLERYNVVTVHDALSLLSMEDLQRAYPNVNWEAAVRIFKLSEHK